MITVSLCLSDIKPAFIKKAKNDKLYVSLVIDQRLQVGKFGETHTVKINKTEQERAIDNTPIYVGNGIERFAVSGSDLAQLAWLSGQSLDLPEDVTPEERKALQSVYRKIEKVKGQAQPEQSGTDENYDGDLPF